MEDLIYDPNANVTPVTPIPNVVEPPVDSGSHKLNDLLSVLSLFAFLWGIFQR